MKILIEVTDASDLVDLMALINGSAAATGKKRPEMVAVDDTGLLRRGKDPGIGYAFETLIIPLARIESLSLSRSLSAATLTLDLHPSEYAILNTLYKKDLANRPKSPF